MLARDQGILPPHAYDREAYRGYAQSPRLMFPVHERSDRLPAKAIVFGVAVGESHRAYPLAVLKSGKPKFEDEVAGTKLRLEFDVSGEVLRAWAGDEEVPVLRAYWFAWFAFHPETTFFEEPASAGR